ncbi:MAG: hypothetical protein SGJ07_03825 [Rhodospirillaceae bacterium]|nr:hypothetical protein [Rhodospirillaceae bacterium]
MQVESLKLRKECWILVVASQFLVIEAFESAISDAQLEGTIRKDLDHKALARHALALGDGVMLHARMGIDRQYAAVALRWFLKSIRAATYPSTTQSRTESERQDRKGLDK